MATIEVEVIQAHQPIVTAEIVQPVVRIVETIPSIGWTPNPQWWDIEKILDNDTEDVGTGGKAIYLLSDADVVTTFPTGYFYKLKTSDGATYTNGGTHTWDASKDKAGLIPTRYVMGYANNGVRNYGYYGALLNNVIYAYFLKCNFNTVEFGSNDTSRVNFSMQSFKLKDCITTTLAGRGLQGMPSLRKLEIPYGIKTIPSYCCAGCTACEELIIPDTVERIEPYSFNGFLVSSLVIPSSVKSCSNPTPGNRCLISIIFEKGSIIDNDTSFSLSYLNRESLLSIIEALVDRTNQSSLTITLGSRNVLKLTNEEKQKVTNKNWILL